MVVKLYFHSLLVTRCKIAWLVTLLKFTRLSFLVACYSFLVACYLFLVACYSLIAGYSLKIHYLQIQSLLFTSCRNHSWEKITRYPLENINYYPLWNSPAWNIACLKSIKIHEETFGLFQCNLFPKAKKLNVVPHQCVTLKPVIKEVLYKKK